MRIYLASGLENLPRAKEVRDLLLVAGHTITYDWMAHGPAGDKGESHMARIAEAECRGVKDADCVVVLLPGGRGTHAELGMALALNKAVLLWDESATTWQVSNSTCAFYWHPCVVRGVGPIGERGENLLAQLVWAPWSGAVVPPRLYSMYDQMMAEEARREAQASGG
jgi:hypothetical protein